jgi:hypothetical protein
MDRAGYVSRLSGIVLVTVLHIPLIAGLLYINLAPGMVRLVTETSQQPDVVLPLPPWPRKSTAPLKGPERNDAGSVVSPATLSPYFSPSAAARQPISFRLRSDKAAARRRRETSSKPDAQRFGTQNVPLASRWSIR